MFLNLIELHNFGIYKGTHVIELTDRIGHRNITLIGGMNGRGKTTVHDAVLLALYGKLANKYIQNERSYDRLLLDHINKHATDDETYVSVSMTLDDGTQLRIVRSWTAKNGNLANCSVRVEKNGTEDKYLGENWNYYIEEILPFGIARFFFFNNEKITQLAEDDSFEQIKSSIKSAIGVTAIESAIHHVDEVIRRKEKDLRAFENSTENRGLQEVISQLDDLEERMAQAVMQLSEAEQQYELANARLEAKEQEFWSAGGGLSVNREAIKQEKQRISDSIGKIQEEIVRLVSDAATPLFLCRGLVAEAHDRERVRLDNNAQQYAREFRKSVYHTLIERLQKVKLSSKALNLVTSILTEELLGEESGGSESPDVMLSPTSMMLFEHLITDNFQSLLQKVESLTSQAEAQESQIMSLDAHLGAADDKSMAIKLFDALKSLEKERLTAENTLKQRQNTVESLNKQIDLQKARRTQLVKSIAEKENANDDSARIVKYSAMSTEVLREFKARLQRSKVERLSAAATDCFQTLVEKDSLVSRIVIDPETLDVTMLDIEGRLLLKSQLSAGEQQMFAISIVWALALTSGYNAPVIIDTPIARLDSSNRVNYVTKYLPTASSQVIVLSTDEEIYGKYLDLIRENVAKYFLLVYRKEEQCTNIIDGYFGEG